MTSTPLPTGAAPGGGISPAGGVSTRPGPVIWTGLGIVSTAAVVLSFATLRDLAVVAGGWQDTRLAALWPLTIDATATVAAVVWISGRGGEQAVRYARTLALVGAVLTITANAAGHGITAAHVQPPWWLAAVLGSIPALALVAVVHLIALMRWAPTAALPAAVVDVAGVSTVAPAIGTDTEPDEVPADVADPELESAAASVHDVPEPAAQTPAEPVVSEGLVVDAEHPDPRVCELLTQLREGAELTGVEVARRYGVGERHGRRLLGDAQDLHDQRPDQGRQLRLIGGTWDV